MYNILPCRTIILISEPWHKQCDNNLFIPMSWTKERCPLSPEGWTVIIGMSLLSSNKLSPPVRWVCTFWKVPLCERLYVLCNYVGGKKWHISVSALTIGQNELENIDLLNIGKKRSITQAIKKPQNLMASPHAPLPLRQQQATRVGTDPASLRKNQRPVSPQHDPECPKEILITCIPASQI